MTCWPTRFESQVWPMPSAPVTIGMATIPATSSVRSCTSFSGIAVSSTPRSRKGGMMPSPAETKISPSRAESCARYGPNSLATRLGKCPRGCRLECELQHLADRHHRVEVHLLTNILRQIVEIGAVPFGQDHIGQAGGVCGEDLLLEAADRQHSSLQGDLTGHADRVLDRATA